MVDPVIVWLIFVVAVAALCMAKPNAGRIFLGLFYMAIGFNIVLSLLNPEAFIELGKNALIPAYRELFLDVVGLDSPLFGLLAAACETAVGLLILNRKSYVKIGLVVGIIFTIAIPIPLGLEEMPNWILALAQAYLLRKEFDITFGEILRTKLH
jgi:hypothetical protein